MYILGSECIYSGDMYFVCPAILETYPLHELYRRYLPCVKDVCSIFART